MAQTRVTSRYVVRCDTMQHEVQRAQHMKTPAAVLSHFPACGWDTASLSSVLFQRVLWLVLVATYSKQVVEVRIETSQETFLSKVKDALNRQR